MGTWLFGLGTPGLGTPGLGIPGLGTPSQGTPSLGTPSLDPLVTGYSQSWLPPGLFPTV